MMKTSSKQSLHYDRFIPFRDNNQNCDYKTLFREQNVSNENLHTQKQSLLTFKPLKIKSATPFDENIVPKEHSSFRKSKENSIIINKGESHVLKAEGFRNDYYTNLLDCKSENTIISILNNTPYIFHRKEKLVSALPLGENQNEEILTSVKFQPQNNSQVAFGSEFGLLRMYDTEKDSTEIYDLHMSRIGCLDWNPKISSLLASGSKDKLIRLKDIRSPDHSVVKLTGHIGEICGLSWAPNGLNIASGGNDNLVNVWDVRNTKTPKAEITSHKAAVRGLCWAPFQENLLASGGGSGDMRIMIHNIEKNKVVKEIATDSQICAISWDEQTKTLITGHGFSRYQICLWDYESERFVYEFLGHNNRVLSLMQVRPSGMVISGSSDETIRIWDIKKVLKTWDRKSSLLTPIKIR